MVDDGKRFNKKKRKHKPQSEKNTKKSKGTTRHICNDKSRFTTYEKVNDGTVLYMGNASTVAIKGKGTVDLEFTSGKVLSLNDVYHVPDVRKNFVSGSVLNKHCFKLVFESDKFVLSKGGIFVGKGYMYQGMFKLNVINNASISAYIVNSLSLWHARLVGKLSRYTSNPSSVHWRAVNRVLRYLRKTIDYGIVYNGYPVVLEGFTNTSRITDREDQSSTSGWIFTFGR
ncbi:hypothetical protein CsSME_00052258 [Camellia sinensis var. sinensis]